MSLTSIQRRASLKASAQLKVLCWRHSIWSGSERAKATTKPQNWLTQDKQTVATRLRLAAQIEATKAVVIV